MNNTPSVFKKRSPGRYITELQSGECITVNGPCTFRLLEASHKGNKNRSQVAVIADPEVKIIKNWKGTFE